MSRTGEMMERPDDGYRPPPLFALESEDVEELCRCLKEAAESLGYNSIESNRLVEAFVKRLP